MNINLKKKSPSVQLPRHIAPTHYKLTLQSDILSSSFSGQEIIKIKVDKEVKTITLHSKDIDIKTVKYTNKSDEQFAARIEYDIKK
jgi:hypothetical protein